MNPRAVDELILGSLDAVSVPLIGQTLCAGFPSPADDFMEEALKLPQWPVPNPPATFPMQIQGESMRGAGIHDRDLASIEHSLQAADGNVVVAVVDEQLSGTERGSATGGVGSGSPLVGGGSTTAFDRGRVKTH